jgi:hypothetical protein
MNLAPLSVNVEHLIWWETCTQKFNIIFSSTEKILELNFCRHVFHYVIYRYVKFQFF